MSRRFKRAPLKRRTFRRRRAFRRRRGTPATRYPWKIRRSFRFVNQLDVDLPAYPTIGHEQTFVYRLTDPGQPVVIGHQALGWQDYVGKYRYWRVIGAKVTLQNNAVQTDDRVVPSIWSLTFKRNTGNMSWGANVTSKYETFGVDSKSMLRIHNVDDAGKNIKKYWSARKWYGPVTLTDKPYWGEFEVGPTEDVYAVISGSNAAANDNPGYAHMLVQIEYIVEFREPNFDYTRDSQPVALKVDPELEEAIQEEIQ